MNLNRTYLSCAALTCLLGVFGVAHANSVPSATAAKTSTKAAQSATSSKASKTVKSAKSTKTAKTAKSVKTAAKSKPVKVAAAPVAAQPANPYLAGRPANPYLANQPVNPFFADQSSNPYLAYRYAKPAPAAKAVPAYKPAQLASAPAAGQGLGMSKISFAPMPVTMYMMPNQKPTMAISTPCSAMEQMTGNSPVFKAFEQMAFGMIGNMNEAGFMPMIIEPVCT